jgi:short-subunit dehydrogenase
MNLILEIIIVSLCVMGGLAILAIMAALIAFAIKYFIRRPYDLPKRYGQRCMVVITGATEGIGKAFAMEFAAQGFKICLIARNAEKLKTVQAEVLANSRLGAVDVMTIEADFKDTDKQGLLDGVLLMLRDQDIGILINNVGMGTWCGPFEEQPLENIKDTIIVNTYVQSFLTRALIAQLSKRAVEGRRSAIINISSNSADIQTPGCSLYSGTKAYNDLFSRSLAEEYEGKIDILSVKPSLVKSSLTKTMDDAWYAIEPEQCVQASIKQLGKSDETYGHWKHALKVWWSLILPRSCQRASTFEKYKKLNAKLKEQMAKSSETPTPKETLIPVETVKADVN